LKSGAQIKRAYSRTAFNWRSREKRRVYRHRANSLFQDNATPSRGTERDMANQHILGRAGDQARRTVRGAQQWIEPLGRFGYAAKGIVYAVIGILAALAAFRAGGALTGSEGALQWIIQLRNKGCKEWLRTQATSWGSL
jgi:hypothetical protein